MGAGAHSIAAFALVGALALGAAARADDPASADAKPDAPPPAVKLTLLEIADLWRNTEGGFSTGDAALNKLRISATLDGAGFGHPGFKAHIQLYATNGPSLSGRYAGDIQTASNIEAPTAVRLFSLWAQESIGDKAILRAGLMDINYDFDSIDPAQLFISSSHGIGPDLSKSGRTGPSIFPVTSPGVEAQWLPGKRLTLKFVVMDGVPGDPDHPGAFVAEKVGGPDGAMLAAQADWHITDDVQASVAVWGYTARFASFDPALPIHAGDVGAYAFVEGPLPVQGWTGWARVGVADPAVNVVANYFGAGVVRTGPIPGRKDDQLGFAVARAGISSVVQRLQGLPDAETSFEAAYRIKVSDLLSLQPGLQYIVHPALAPHLGNALLVGLRFIITVNAPAGSSDAED